jgi:kynureninase
MIIESTIKTNPSDTMEVVAQRLDEEDPLKHTRGEFFLPQNNLGRQNTYLCNNSLGLQLRAVPALIQEELTRWARLGVDGWFEGNRAWYNRFEQALRQPLARLLGALNEEVIFMNSLTVNLHLLMVSFYRPTKERYKIVIDAPTFPSDLYAIKCHLHNHGYHPEEALIVLEPRLGEHSIDIKEIEGVLEQQGESVALVFLSGVNFLSGQLLPMEKIARLGHQYGCVVGYDLAHVAGNVPVRLHDWDVDFAVGCSYKYLCGGPGSVGLAFVHQKHFGKSVPRFAGWWGNDPKTRFKMQLEEKFIPCEGAAGWQVSTPSILALAPLQASLAIYDEVGMDAIRKKSELQTTFFLQLIAKIPSHIFEVITPINSAERGSQISLLIHQNPLGCLEALSEAGITADFREPNVIRITPQPLYNTFHELWYCARVLKDYFAD